MQLYPTQNPSQTVKDSSFAIAVAIIGFASSLLVVIINAVVTLLGKKIDAQQKKDEHSLALQKQFLGRKLDTAEVAVGRWTLQIKKLDWAYNHFANLNLGRDLTKDKNEYFGKTVQMINDKVSELQFTDKDYFATYFNTDIKYSNDDEEIITKQNKYYSEMNEHLTNLPKLVSKHNKAEGEERKRYMEEFTLTFKNYESTKKSYLEYNRKTKEILEHYVNTIRSELNSLYAS